MKYCIQSPDLPAEERPSKRGENRVTKAKKPFTRNKVFCPSLVLHFISASALYAALLYASHFLFQFCIWSQIIPFAQLQFLQPKKHKAVGVGFLNIVSRSQESSTMLGISKSLIENFTIHIYPHWYQFIIIRATLLQSLSQGTKESLHSHFL